MQFFITQYNPPPIPEPAGGRGLNSPVFYEQYQDYFRNFYTGLTEWTRQITKVINTGTMGVGFDIPAATDITVSAYQHIITGTGNIQNIFTVPNLPASHLTLISRNGFALVTGGNISLGRNVQAGQAVMLVWGPVDQVWYPIISTADTGDVPEAPGFFFVSAIDANRRALIDFTQPGHIGQVLPQLYDYTATWQAGHTYTIPTYITDSNGNIQQLTTAGVSGGAPPTWSVVLDGLTPDGSAVWENVGGSGAAPIILHSPKYLQVDVHQATPAEIRFTTAAGVVVSKITKGVTAATDLSLIPATTATGTLALGDVNTWNHIKLLAATDILLQAITAQITATVIQLQAVTNVLLQAADISVMPTTTATGTLNLGDANIWNHIKLLAATDVLLQAADIFVIPMTTATGTLALGDTNIWNHIKLLSAIDIVLQAVTAQIVATTIQLQATTNQIQGAVELTNTVTKYKNIVTVSNGVPSEYATVDLTGQTAAIAATTIYAVPAAGQGMYRISYVATVTTVATVSSILGGANGFQVVFTNADGSVVVTTPVSATSNLNTTQAYLSGSLIVYAKASTNIQYSFGYTSVNAAEMVFALHIKVEAL